MKRRLITAEEVREYRDRTGEGMHRAKQVLQAKYDKEFIDWLIEHGTIEERVNFLLENSRKTIINILKTHKYFQSLPPTPTRVF